jgi:hypothetical protein
VGINFTAPEAVPDATHLTNAPRRTVLAELIPALRAAASARGALSAQELAAFADRDYARGRGCVAPGVGVVLGIGEGGELLVQTAAGLQRYVSGSLELQ